MNWIPSKHDAAIAVWIVEDDVEYRESIVYLLNHTSDMCCTGVFFDFEEVEAYVSEMKPWDEPDVVLMDIRLPGVDGIEGVFRLKSHLPSVSFLMLTSAEEEKVIFDSLRAGASGYLLKTTPMDQTLSAIRETFRGGMLIPAMVADKVLEFFARSQPAKDYNLTAREREVLEWMCQGYAQKQIAEELYLSIHTIDNYVRQIYQKLHVNSGLAAVAKAIREGIV